MWTSYHHQSSPREHSRVRRSQTPRYRECRARGAHGARTRCPHGDTLCFPVVFPAPPKIYRGGHTRLHQTVYCVVRIQQFINKRNVKYRPGKIREAHEQRDPCYTDRGNGDGANGAVAREEEEGANSPSALEVGYGRTSYSPASRPDSH